MNKSEFVRSFQEADQPFHPHEVSQRVRKAIGCVSSYHGDPDLSTEHFRGYMVRYKEKPNRSAEDPELYICVISTQQSAAYQHVIWIKEIIQIFDSVDHRTDTADKLQTMLVNRATNPTHSSEGESHVVADKNGFILALGVAVPRAYREICRKQNFLARYPNEDIEKLLNIPAEFVEFVLGQDFAKEFEAALAACE